MVVAATQVDSGGSQPAEHPAGWPRNESPPWVGRRVGGHTSTTGAAGDVGLGPGGWRSGRNRMRRVIGVGRPPGGEHQSPTTVSVVTCPAERRHLRGQRYSGAGWRSGWRPSTAEPGRGVHGAGRQHGHTERSALTPAQRGGGVAALRRGAPGPRAAAPPCCTRSDQRVKPSGQQPSGYCRERDVGHRPVRVRPAQRHLLRLGLRGWEWRTARRRRRDPAQTLRAWALLVGSFPVGGGAAVQPASISTGSSGE
jgi:hypothetical protein